MKIFSYLSSFKKKRTCDTPVGVLVLLPQLGLQNVLVELQERAGHSDVGQGDALPNEVRSGEEVGVEEREVLLHVFPSPVVGGLVEGHDAKAREHPRA